MLIFCFTTSFANVVEPGSFNTFFGKMYYVAGGSTEKHYLVPLKVVPVTTQKVILGYAVISIAPSIWDGGIDLENDNGVIKLQNVMLNCKNKTYAEEYGTTNIEYKIYLAGDSYNWDDLYNYDGEPYKFSALGSADDKPIQELFQKTCDYVAQF